MHSSIDPFRTDVPDNKLQAVLEKHNEAFADKIETVQDLKQYTDALDLAKVLYVPTNKDPIDHTRDLSLAAKKGYKVNATELADKQHQAARILAEYYDFDWKQDVIAKEDLREGKLE